MKKVFALVLALVMAMSLTTVAWGVPALDTYDSTTGVSTVYGLTLTPTPSDPASHGTITVSDKDGLLKLTNLVNDWSALFSNGSGTDYSNYASINGGKGTDYYYDWTWKIVLTADIDFGGATIDPINLGQKLIFDGQGHTIKNAVITTDSSTENKAGLFNGAQCGFTNLKLDNIHVTGSNIGNSCVGVLSGSCDKAISNITVTNSSATNGKYTGGIVGYGYTSITNCTVTDCTVKGGYKLGGLIGYICASGNNTADVTNNTLTDCTVDGLGGGVFAGGKTEYKVGMLVGNYNADGDCGGNAVTDMTTSATEMIGEVEANITVNESSANTESTTPPAPTPSVPVYPYYPPVVEDTTDKTVDSAQTFDAGIALYVGVSVLGAMGTVALSKKRED